MARYNRRSGKGDAKSFLLLVALILVVLLIKVILVLLAGVLTGFALRYYYKWHLRRLAYYNNDPKLFWHSELKIVFSKVLSVLLIAIGLSLLFFKFWNGVALLSLGVYLYPAVQKRIAERLGLHYSYRSNMVAVGLVSLLLLTNYSYDAGQSDGQRSEDRANEIKQQALVASQKRSASLLVDSARQFLNQKSYKKALATIDRSLELAPGNDTAELTKAAIQFELGHYGEAIAALDNISNTSPEAHFLKAKCLIKTGPAASALTDLKIASESGIPEAGKLYNKVNPIIRKLSGYITRCCDGSISYARGRGACSHHGGVCDWNEPVYEEYRKYEE